MDLQERVTAFTKLGLLLHKQCEEATTKNQNELWTIMHQSHLQNKWFTVANQQNAINGLVTMLQKDELKKWTLSYYGLRTPNSKLKTVSIICAGNIPAVAFHDLLCVLISGNKVQLKLSSDDAVLFPYLIKTLITIEPRFNDYIQIVERVTKPDAVIATGSNNSARYFEYYFGKYPHIIRKNRNGVAVLYGRETAYDFKKLGHDIFNYFGLGCRNVSKLYVPLGYDFAKLFEALESYGQEMMSHNKYMNNYDYHHALFLLEAIPFLTNNFLILKEDTQIATPVSILNYEFYKSDDELKHLIASNLEHIQCIVSNRKILGNEIEFGKTQEPSVSDYADGVDTMEFLVGQKN